MTRLVLRAAPAALAAAALGTAGAQAPQQPPAAHPIGAVLATTSEPLGALQAVRQLADGRVLVNDQAKRRVLLFDPTLTTFTVVADSTSATANAYSGRVGGLIPYRGDSTLFVDPSGMTMMVIDPKGALGRTMAIPRPDDAMALTGVAFGAAGFDTQGRLVYRAPPRFNFRPNPNGAFTPPVMPDSAPIVRVDLATRKLDTVTFLKVFAPKMSVTQGENGRMSINSIVDPLPVIDDWAVLTDGTVAVLRGRDFHLDAIGADGKVASSGKVPHDWQRMSDDEKVAFLDSTKTAMEKQRADMQARMQAAGGMDRMIAAAGGPGAPAVIGGGGGGPPMIRMEIGPGGPGGGGAPPQRGQQGGPNGGPGGNGTFQLPPLTLVSANELPDYKPPFGAGAARADADGNVWVRMIPTKPTPGYLYDVIDKDGKLTDRVIVPANSAIAGFGPGGIVYLGVRDPATGTLKLQKMKAR